MKKYLVACFLMICGISLAIIANLPTVKDFVWIIYGASMFFTISSVALIFKELTAKEDW